FERAASIAARRAPDGEAPLALNANRGNVLRWLGRPEEALDAHQHALAQARRDGDPSALMQSLAGTAIDLLRLQRVDDAQVLVTQGEALLQQGNHPTAGSAAMSLRNATATLRRAQNRWREADDVLAAMEATYEQNRSRSTGLATVLVDRSKIALVGRRPADALQLAERALAMAENSRGDLPYSASSGEGWLAVARAHHAARDAAAARDACTQAVRHFAATVDPSHPSLADARAGGDARLNPAWRGEAARRSALVVRVVDLVEPLRGHGVGRILAHLETLPQIERRLAPPAVDLDRFQLAGVCRVVAAGIDAAGTGAVLQPLVDKTNGGHLVTAVAGALARAPRNVLIRRIVAAQQSVCPHPAPG
ncbi:MAG TPA: tetratricopeptide repeat protein, partial [Burkholderiaceae bacterium]